VEELAASKTKKRKNAGIKKKRVQIKKKNQHNFFPTSYILQDRAAAAAAATLGGLIFGNIELTRLPYNEFNDLLVMSNRPPNRPVAGSNFTPSTVRPRIGRSSLTSSDEGNASNPINLVDDTDDSNVQSISTTSAPPPTTSRTNNRRYVFWVL
jgi:hypothetical protein